MVANLRYTNNIILSVTSEAELQDLVNRLDSQLQIQHTRQCEQGNC